MPFREIRDNSFKKQTNLKYIDKIIGYGVVSSILALDQRALSSNPGSAIKSTV